MLYVALLAVICHFIDRQSTEITINDGEKIDGDEKRTSISSINTIAVKFQNDFTRVLHCCFSKEECHTGLERHEVDK